MFGLELPCFEVWRAIKRQVYLVSEESNNCAIWARREKTCLRGFANNTGADQLAHLRRLISAFVIRFLESTIFNLATGEISIF